MPLICPNRLHGIFFVLFLMSMAGWLVLDAVEKKTAEEILRIHQEVLAEQAKVPTFVLLHLPENAMPDAHATSDKRVNVEDPESLSLGDRS